MKSIIKCTTYSVQLQPTTTRLPNQRPVLSCPVCADYDELMIDSTETNSQSSSQSSSLEVTSPSEEEEAVEIEEDVASDSHSDVRLD